MQNISRPYSNVSLQEAVQLVAAVGDTTTVIVQGHIGTGKSSMLNILSEMLPTHQPFYFDCTTADVGDISIPRLTDDSVTFVPNENLGFHSSKPVIVMIDEIGKATRGVFNGVLRVLQERKIGKYSLPEGSIVFATTNLGLEGVGDMLPPHARNRVCVVKVRKPTAQEWVENYALKAGIHHVIQAAVLEYPSMFEDFENVEDPNCNNYIYHPKRPLAAFVTPRSLERASHILNSTENLPDDVRAHALIGTVGEAAAMDIMTLTRLDETLPNWRDIVANPMNTKVPTKGVAQIMLATKACRMIERDTMLAWMEYCQRMPKEVQALFGRSVMRSDKKTIAMHHEAFTKWTLEILPLL